MRAKEICKKPEYIVFKLRLHESLWDYLNRFSTSCACQACSSHDPVLDIRSYEIRKNKIKDRTFQFCIINSFVTQNMLADCTSPETFRSFSLDEKILWANCKLRRIDYGLQNRGQFGKKLCFHVKLKLIGEES